MAWTAPMTFTDGQVLTASQLNTHLRDNMFETECAKVTTDSEYLVALGRNRINQRRPIAARVDTTETTTSTDFTDLATVGPSATMNTGVQAIVFIKCDIFNSASDSAGGMAFDIHGVTPEGEDGTDREADDSWMAMTDGVTNTSGNVAMACVFISSLTLGPNTFTAKYKVGSGTGSFRYRHIAVCPF